jgi:transposase-like protein
MDRILTKQEKEKLVLDLLNQGKNTREIAQEAGMSFRDIGAIRDKATKEKEASKEQAEKISVLTQAYKLFSEDKTPLQVAIELKLEADEVNKYHKEYLKLINRDNLCQIYEEIGDDDIEPFVKLYKSAKSAGMNPQHVNRLLAIANNDLPSVEHRCQELERN